MLKENNRTESILEIKKRPPGKPLTFAELETLR